MIWIYIAVGLVCIGFSVMILSAFSNPDETPRKVNYRHICRHCNKEIDGTEKWPCNACYKKDAMAKAEMEKNWKLGYRNNTSGSVFTIFTIKVDGLISDVVCWEHQVHLFMLEDEAFINKIILAYNNCEYQEFKDLFKSYINAVALQDEELANKLENMSSKVMTSCKFKEHAADAAKLLERLDEKE